MTSRGQFAYPVLIVLATAASVSAQTQSTVPTVVTQMERAQAENRTHVIPYIVVRDYRLIGRESGTEIKSSVVAKITVLPPDSKKYTIEESDGSGWGEKIVRKMLDGEVAFAKDSGASDITRDNYDFRLAREDEMEGQRCYVLELVPKRKSKDLLNGTIWVDANTYLPQRVEGEPAKNPSWWLKDVRVALRYGYVGPMWVQTSSEATANVRVVGGTTVRWQDVGYQIGNLTPGTLLEQTMTSNAR